MSVQFRHPVELIFRFEEFICVIHLADGATDDRQDKTRSLMSSYCRHRPLNSYIRIRCSAHRASRGVRVKLSCFEMRGRCDSGATQLYIRVASLFFNDVAPDSLLVADIKSPYYYLSGIKLAYHDGNVLKQIRKPVSSCSRALD